MIIVKFDDRDYHLDSQKDVTIDPGDIDSEFINLPALIEDYGTLAEHLGAKVAALQYKLERTYALIDHQMRIDITNAGEKITETKVANAVITQQEYRRMKEELLDSTKEHNLVKAVLRALHTKKECLISLGANLRQGGEFRILAKEAAAYTPYLQAVPELVDDVISDEEISKALEDGAQIVAESRARRENSKEMPTGVKKRAKKPDTQTADAEKKQKTVRRTASGETSTRSRVVRRRIKRTKE